jgi:fumarate reductase flavoprotein subunit
VLVDKQGRRLDTARPAVSVAMTQERAGYIVMPGAVADKFRAHPFYLSTAPGIAYAYVGDYERGRPDIVHRASSLPALAQALGMNAQELAQSTDGGSAQGPWLALGPVRAMLTTTEGAVRVDTSCRVLNANDQVIDGLYAVGCIGQGGLLLRGHGLHLAWAFTSGRVAGQDASRQAAQGAR